jgi:hypothetical protein
MQNAYIVLVEEPEWKRSLKDLGVDGCIILKWILKNRVGASGLDSFD